MKGEKRRREAHTACMSPSIAVITSETALVALSGELDLAARVSVESLVRDLLDSGAREILVDLADVTFMDCGGLGILVRATELAERRAAHIYLVRAQGQPRELLDYSAAARRSSVRRTRGRAIRSRDAIAA